MQNGDDALPSIILAGQGLLVKMLITLEPHNIFYHFLILKHFLKLAGKMTKKKIVTPGYISLPNGKPVKIILQNKTSSYTGHNLL